MDLGLAGKRVQVTGGTRTHGWERATKRATPVGLKGPLIEKMSAIGVARSQR